MQVEGEKTGQDFLLKVNNLSTHFRTERGVVKAVDNVSFVLKRGETIGIVGESGSGKSVTALSIMQLIPNPPGKIAEGSIEFNHPQKGIIDLVSLNKMEMQEERGNSISMIFQEPMTSLNPVFTCGDQVMEAIQLHQKVSKQEAKKRTIELFQKVELPRPEAIFDAYPHQISGGQKQRVMIAMAMSCNPSVLIADEPTTALDVTVQARILELMQQLRDENNMGILFITHDLGVVAEIADRVIVMYQGKIVEQGPVYEIFSNPQHPYTKGLLACRPKLDLRLKVLPVVSDFMEVDTTGKFLEKERKFSSIGEAILFNYVSDEDIAERNSALSVLEPQLKIKNLKTWFPVKKGFFGKTVDHVKAVDDVSFDVFPGETIGLVGESGCGKTTLGRSILRLIDPTSGSIEFEGIDILALNEKELRNLRKDIQIIFQDPYSSLNPRMTIGEAIIEPMRVNNILDSDFARKKHAIELLERVNLNRKQFNRYPHEFSGGQRQRICIARALALNPKFIICDESVSALDVSVQAQVLNLLNELKEEFNFTYIFISHDLSVVKFMSDRIIVMNKGKIEEMGFAEDIYLNPKTDYTKRLIHSIPKGNLEDILLAQLKRKKKV
ncbi:MAG: ABC transporter ATP-binding protein [Cytophaga sp.]|uniref:ABC transporter ATP-binding protein n=1 Tax=Cytophaga sp. TaxID=29535 RepID=UPI003F7EB132